MKTDESQKNRPSNVLPQVFGASAAAIGLVALLGWILGFPFLASFGADLIPMAPSTALLFVLFGVVLFFHNRFPQSRGVYVTGLAVGSMGAMMALLLFYFSSAGIYSHIEHFGISLEGTVGGVPIGHMSPLTAVCFVVAAFSFLTTLTSSAGRPRRATMALVLACVVGVTSLVLMLAYFFGKPLLYGGEFIPPALPTSLAFLLLALGLIVTAGLQVWPFRRIKESATSGVPYIFALVFVLLASGIVAVGYFYYGHYEKQYKTGIEHQLSAIAELKTDEIVQWRKERLGDAAAIYTNVNFSELVRRYLERPAYAQKRLRAWMGQVREAYQYDRLCLYDTGIVERLSYPKEIVPTDSIFRHRASEVLRTRQIAFQDFYRDEQNGRVYLNMLIPIFDDHDTHRVIGILAMRINPEQYLYPLVNRWPIPSRSAETLIIRREENDALFLNELRFQKNAALTLRIPLSQKDVAAVRAARGEEGIIESIDYRGVSVIAYVRAVPNSPWFLVARVDISEVFSPLQERLWMMVIFACALILGAGASVGLVWRHQRAGFYREKYEAAEALGESEKRYRSLKEQEVIRKSADEASEFAESVINTVREPLISLDQDLRVVSVSRSFYDVFKVKPEETVGQLIYDLGNKQWDIPKLRELLETILPQKTTFDNYEVEHDFTAIGKRIMLLNARQIQRVWGKERIILLAIEDITERRKLEEAHSKLAAIVESADDAVIGRDLEGIIVSWNSGAEVVYGYSAKEVIGNSISLLMPPDHPDEYKELLAKKLNGEHVKNFETQRRRKDGQIIDVSLTISPVKDTSGKITGDSVIARDITEKKKLEEGVMQAKDVAEAANKELEAFSYSVSHDLRAPLRAIDGFSRIVVEEYAKKLDAEGNRLLNVVRANTQKMDELITDLLSLSRFTRSEMQFSRVDMFKLADSIYHEIVSPEVRKDFSFSVAAIPDAYCDPSLMRQVWINLISNAVKFTTPNDVRTIEIGSRLEDGMNMYSIKDSGVGFNPEYTHKLFGVFQRLHKAEEFEGTGVGLAIVQRIIHRHGGRVWAEGMVGKGATFFFSIPSRQ